MPNKMKNGVVTDPIAVCADLEIVVPMMPILGNDQGDDNVAEDQCDLHGTVKSVQPEQKDSARDQDDEGNRRNDRIRIRRFLDDTRRNGLVSHMLPPFRRLLLAYHAGPATMDIH